jgi:hypothetical protein
VAGEKLIEYNKNVKIKDGHSMAEWRVRLSGDESSLIELSKSSVSCNWKIVQDDDGKYYLESSEFESMTEEKDVRLHSINIIDILKWIGKLSINNFEPIQFAYVMGCLYKGLCPIHIVGSATTIYSAPSVLSTPLDFM